MNPKWSPYLDDILLKSLLFIIATLSENGSPSWTDAKLSTNQTLKGVFRWSSFWGGGISKATKVQVGKSDCCWNCPIFRWSAKVSQWVPTASSCPKALWKGVQLKSSLSSISLKLRAALLCISAYIPTARYLCRFKGHSAHHGCSRCLKEFPGGFGEREIIQVLTGKTGSLTVTGSTA